MEQRVDAENTLHRHTEKSGSPTKTKNPYNNKCAKKFAERLAFACTSSQLEAQFRD